MWLLAALLLIIAGIAYRVPAERIRALGKEPIQLPVPLSRFPMEIAGWVGRDLSIPTTTQEYMTENFADDYLSRRYINSLGKRWVDVYVVYCSSRPAGILGHRPRVCYPAHGWQHEGTEKRKLVSKAGVQIDCLMHRFYRLSPDYERRTVLSFYVLGGRITADERDFSGPFGRRPNIARDPSRYVAQVQISSTLEEAVTTAARNMADAILEFLPDQNGRVRAAERIGPLNDDLRSGGP